jgi:hypothetical protein
MSYLIPFVLFVLGLILWRLQLGAKRRFEVAEQTLTAFERASDGLSRLRDPFIYTGELAAAEVPKVADEGEGFPREVDKTEKERVRLHNVYVARAESVAPAFAELRAAQILAEIHIGRAAADAVDVLFRGRHQVFQAISELHGAVQFDPEHERATAEQIRQHRERGVTLRRNIAEHRDNKTGKPVDTDALSQKIDEAKATLESMCRPFLEDPPWLRKLSDILRRWQLLA